MPSSEPARDYDGSDLHRRLKLIADSMPDIDEFERGRADDSN